MAKLGCDLVSIYAPKNQSEELINRLQQMAVMDIETASCDEETSFLPEGYALNDTEEGYEELLRNLNLAEASIKTLDERFPEKKGLLSFLEGNKEIALQDFYLTKTQQQVTLNVIEEISAKERNIAEQKAEVLRLSALEQQLKPWLSLDVPLSFSGTAETASFIGSVVGGYDLSSLLATIASTDPELNLYAEIVSSGKDLTYIFVLCAKEDAAKTENVLRELGFARPVQLCNNTALEETKAIGKKLLDCERAILENTEGIKKLSEKREEIELFADYCRAQAEKASVAGEIVETDNTVLIRGYVVSADTDFLLKKLNEEFCVVVEVEKANEELAPVKLKNGAFASPAETITQMYSLPSSKDIDPTPLTGFFYYFLFGMMLSDAGYGLLMVLGTAFVLKKFNLKQSMRNTMKLFLYCGISTMLWGLIFGSFFGDSIAVITETFFGKRIALPALIDPMNGGAVHLLILSLAIGLVQIIAGLCAKFVTCIKNGDKAGAFFDAGLWITTLIGFAVLAVGIMAFKPLTKVGAVITIASLVGLILTQGRAHKNPVLRLLLGVKSLYDITGYVSDLLSFSRLMALGLTTAAMGAVFNLLGTLGGKSIGGVILMLIIFPVGHAIGFALNALGAYVHTLRLQYVELFSKFYDGGGREFKPFSIKSKYIDIKNTKEEN